MAEQPKSREVVEKASDLLSKATFALADDLGLATFGVLVATDDVSEDGETRPIVLHWFRREDGERWKGALRAALSALEKPDMVAYMRGGSIGQPKGQA